jgi:hypothetical protein
LYKYETEIIYYKDQKIASIEVKQINLKRYERDGVTTGIQKTAILDSVSALYFDQEQRPVSRVQYAAIRAKVCQEE